MRLLVTLAAMATALLIGAGCELVSNDDSSTTMSVTDDGTLVVLNADGSTGLAYNAGADMSKEEGAE